MNRLDAKPLVHGYLFVEGADEARVAEWISHVRSFCERSGYRLGSIFIDHAGSSGSFARGGFIELLAALRLTVARWSLKAWSCTPPASTPPCRYSNS